MQTGRDKRYIWLELKIVKRLFKLCGKTILVATVLTLLLSGSALAADSYGPMGPAPNSGDGVPDGSGLEAPNGPNGND